MFAHTLDKRMSGITMIKIRPLLLSLLLIALACPAAAALLLPHHEELAPGVHAAGFAARYQSGNCGWVELAASTLLIDLPRGMTARDYLDEVRRHSPKPVRQAALTRLQPGDHQIVEALLAAGVEQIVVSRELAAELVMGSETISPAVLRVVRSQTTLEGGISYIPLDGTAAKAAAAVYVQHGRVLFAGPAGVNGPRARIPGGNTARWLEAIHQLETLEPQTVVPAFGSWGGKQTLARLRWYLTELRRQVAYGIALGWRPEKIFPGVRMPSEYFVWIPYDRPRLEDVRHIYRELTVPSAPFRGRPPAKDDARPHALVLIADRYHDPEHIEKGLAKVFKATGVVPHFTFDTQALTAENLARVRLLVILKDGMLWPEGVERGKKYKIWMTPEQEKAVVDFVERGGAFLNLHNSMGLYPKDGPYLNLVGGRYIGHGPLERFRVEVADPNHPITQGVEDFSVADEQHTPPYDEGKVHLLLRSRSDDGKRQAAAGWAYEPGKGRLVHLAPGHTREAVEHPMFQRLMRNAVQWLLAR